MTNPYINKQSLLFGTAALVMLLGVTVYTMSTRTQAPVEPMQDLRADSGQREVITLAGGCFWCTEAFFQEAPGVVDAVSGYAGGVASDATYKEVSKGITAHREAVQVTYDPTRISPKEILDIYWGHIDPTDTEGQFADRGFQYTTAIYYHTDEQKVVAEASKLALSNSGLFEKPIAPLILPYTTFFPAEEYHQDYYKKSADHYERYKKGSGRAGFIEENWAKTAALEFLAAEEATAIDEVYTGRTFSTAEIEAGLKTLSPDAYKVVAQEGTEPPYKNAYWDNKEEGIYVDVVTGRPLFSSKHKYDSKTGWPSFYQALPDANLELKSDTLLIYERVEVRSESGHLGHVFDDGPQEHGGKRYCINSLALKFVPKADMERLGYGAYLFDI
jgi:peptide methionine sulfoxide reductase msrA/msrB